MAEVIKEWAGKERLFRLNFGAVLDIEEALGRDPIGSVFLRVTSGQFRANDVYQIIRIALICGGESPVEAKRLVEAHFDTRPYIDNSQLAGDILLAIMVGVEEGGPTGDGEPAPMKFSEISQICRTFNLSPIDLREMPYADFRNMCKGFAAAQKTAPEPPTEEEFEAILAKYEPEALT